MPRSTATLTFNQDQLFMLMNSMQREYTDFFTEDELKQHDKLYARLEEAAAGID